jgi:hypothetical protein
MRGRRVVRWLGGTRSTGSRSPTWRSAVGTASTGGAASGLSMRIELKTWQKDSAIASNPIRSSSARLWRTTDTSHRASPRCCQGGRDVAPELHRSRRRPRTCLGCQGHGEGVVPDLARLLHVALTKVCAGQAGVQPRLRIFIPGCGCLMASSRTCRPSSAAPSRTAMTPLSPAKRASSKNGTRGLISSSTTRARAIAARSRERNASASSPADLQQPCAPLLCAWLALTYVEFESRPTLCPAERPKPAQRGLGIDG